MFTAGLGIDRVSRRKYAIQSFATSLQDICCLFGLVLVLMACVAKGHIYCLQSQPRPCRPQIAGYDVCKIERRGTNLRGSGSGGVYSHAVRRS